MSALGSILAAVEEKVTSLLAGLTARDDAQDERLDAIEARLDALEKPVAKPSPTVAAKARTASSK